MTIHIYWRPVESPTEPFTHIGECIGVAFEHGEFRTPGGLLNYTSIALLDFEGKPPNHPYAFARHPLPLGEYQLAGEDGDRHVMATLVKAIGGREAPWVLRTETEHVQWGRRGEVPGN